MNGEIKSIIIDKLRQRSVYLPNTSGTQHVTRCPYCPDSYNPTHGHFSIRIDTSDDSPLWYHCLKCGAGGVLDNETVDDLDIYIDDESRKMLKSYTKKSSRLAKLVNTECERYEVPFFHDTDLAKRKLFYINNRLGTNIDIEEAKRLKIVLNLFDFLKFNEIAKIDNIGFKLLEMLHYNYVGFLSVNNNCITFRNITNNPKQMRYFKLFLNPKNTNKDTFYAIQNSYNLLSTDPINIHISEGTFDIMSIFKNLLNEDMDHHYYFANCGFGAITILRYLVHKGINTGLNLHIYADNDKSDWDHKKYINRSNLIEWTDSVKLHRNQFQHEKDFGIPRSNMIDSSQYIRRVK